MFWLLACVAIAALVLSLSFTWIVRYVASSRGWVSGPASRRHVHRLPIPRLGGIAIILSFAAIVALLFASGWRFHLLPICLIPAGWIFAVGLIDDSWGLRASRKLAAQIIAGAILFELGLRIPFGPGTAGWIASLLATVFWTTTLTNAINLVDGLDGLASGASLCALAAMLIAALYLRQQDLAVLTVILLGAVLGFLRFNLPPATIFLGDSGSLTIGVLIAAISIRLLQTTPLAWIVCVLALAHPLAELTISTTRRGLTANPLFRPDRRHMHHRLLDRNISHEASAGLLVALSVVFSGLAVLAVRGGLPAAIAIVLAIIVGSYVLQAFQYNEFRYFRLLVRKILDHRYTIDAHVQLDELAQILDGAQTVTQLRNLLNEAFVGFGFRETVLSVPELDRQPRRLNDQKGLELAFSLVAHQERIGTLLLRWDLGSPMPLDLTLFATEFLPSVTITVQRHVEISRMGTFAVRRQTSRPQLVQVVRDAKPVGAGAELTPLRN